MGSVQAESKKVALITGGASGMGLAVATALTKRGTWVIHLLDLNGVAGINAVKSLGSNAFFHKVNITIYADLAKIFDDIFRAEGRLDFVYGNAGIVERFNFYERHEESGPPPDLDMRVVDINLKAVYTTSYLALHYLRQSPASDRALVLTASCGGLYPNAPSAMYAGTKHAVIGFMRSIAAKYQADGIRVNATCPGAVKTGLLEPAAWEAFPQHFFTPLSMIVDTVLKLIDGDTMTDAKGVSIKAGDVWGKAVEISNDKFYFRDQPEFCDETMATLMGSSEAKRDKLPSASGTV